MGHGFSRVVVTQIFLCSSLKLGKIPMFDLYFSQGLKPPTRFLKLKRVENSREYPAGIFQHSYHGISMYISPIFWIGNTSSNFKGCIFFSRQLGLVYQSVFSV